VWNPGVAGLAMSPDACKPTSEKTNRARRGRRRFNIGGASNMSGNGLGRRALRNSANDRCPEPRVPKPVSEDHSVGVCVG
jgi:hypothetical protein